MDDLKPRQGHLPRHRQGRRLELKLVSSLHLKNGYLDPHFHVSGGRRFLFIAFICSYLRDLFLFSNFVPISLILTLEIVKFWQGTFMGWDLEMYDDEQDFYMKAQTTNINEELG